MPIPQRYACHYDVGVFRHKFSEYVAQAWNSRRAGAIISIVTITQ